MKYTFSKNKFLIALPLSMLIKHKDGRLYNFNEFENNIKKKMLNTKTDLFIWGNGYADDTSIYTNFHPHRIKKFTNNKNNKLPNDIIDITFNEFYSAAIDKDFNVYVWKEPKLNAEKNFNIDNHTRDDIIKLDIKLKVVSAKFTKDRLFLLTSDGNVYMYLIDINYPKHNQFFEKLAPEPIVTLDINNIHVKELKNIVQIASGKDHLILLDKNGKLFGMGDDSFGQLGLNTFVDERESQMRIYGNFIERRERLPKLIDIPEKIKKVVCGENHTLALSESGRVYGFGYNRFLQLSNDDLYRQKKIGLSKPTLISEEKFNSQKIVDIAASKNCSFFICRNEKDGSYNFFSSGEGLRGTLGQNLIKHMSDIELMPDISGLINSDNMKPFEPLKLVCGNGHCLLLFKNPRLLYVWGNNEFGELGTKDRVFYESPIPMLEEYNLPFNIINVSANGKSSAFICEKIDKSKKRELLNKDKEIYEEELKKQKKKKKPKNKVEEVKVEERSELRIKLDEFIKMIRKYI